MNYSKLVSCSTSMYGDIIAYQHGLHFRQEEQYHNHYNATIEVSRYMSTTKLIFRLWADNE